MTVQKLIAINEQLTDATLSYAASKLLYKEREADLLLNTDFAEVLGKSRPTVAEKDAYVLIQLQELKSEVDQLSVKVDDLKRRYEIEKLNIRFTGDFLSSIATGAGLE